MRTTCSSSHRGGVCLSACWDTFPWVWDWRPPRCGPGDCPRYGPGDPPGCGPGDPPGCGPGDPLRCGPGDPPVWAWRPPRPDPSTSPLGVGLETCKACWDTTCNACWDTTTPLWTEFLTHTTENITLPQTSFAGSNNIIYCAVHLDWSQSNCKDSLLPPANEVAER